MASKEKLRRKLVKQKIKHRLEMNDLQIELNNTNYNLSMEELQSDNLRYTIELMKMALVASGLQYLNGRIVDLPIEEEKETGGDEEELLPVEMVLDLERELAEYTWESEGGKTL